MIGNSIINKTYGLDQFQVDPLNSQFSVIYQDEVSEMTKLFHLSYFCEL